MSTINLPFPGLDDPADGATQIQALAEAVAAILAETIFRPGDIKLGAQAQAPTGWLVCNGQELARVGTYAALFAAIGTTYGQGDGQTTFSIPDLRGCCVRVDPFELGWLAGSDTVTLTQAQLPAHGHGVIDPGHGHAASDNAGYPRVAASPGFFGGPWGMAAGSAAYAIVASGGQSQQIGSISNTGRANTGLGIQTTGGNQAHSNLPRSLNLNAFIKT